MAETGRLAGRKVSFQQAFDLLSRYLKQKGRSVDGLSLGMPLASGDAGGHARGQPVDTPRTMNLLSSLEASGESKSPNANEPSAQMTIFYAGKVMVFENFPAERLKQIMAMTITTPPGDAAPLDGPVDSSSGKDSAAAGNPISSDLPIARRVSLKRFLEKRKDRITSKAPYPAHGSPSTAFQETKKEQPWLGLAPVSAD